MGGKGIHIYTMRDRMPEMPGKADAWPGVMRSLLAYAMRIEMRSDNPAVGIKQLELGAYEPRPADLLSIALEKAAPMTQLAIITGPCGDRRPKQDHAIPHISS